LTLTLRGGGAIGDGPNIVGIPAFGILAFGASTGTLMPDAIAAEAIFGSATMLDNFRPDIPGITKQKYECYYTVLRGL
jgi:hypothetical protein